MIDIDFSGYIEKIELFTYFYKFTIKCLQSINSFTLIVGS